MRTLISILNVTGINGLAANLRNRFDGITAVVVESFSEHVHAWTDTAWFGESHDVSPSDQTCPDYLRLRKRSAGCFDRRAWMHAMMQKPIPAMAEATGHQVARPDSGSFSG